MPYRDPEAQRAYFKEYARKNRARKNALANERNRRRRAANPLPEPWGVEVGKRYLCRSCGLSAYKLPSAECKEPKHLEYVRKRRITGRSRGAKYREKARRRAVEALGGRCVKCGFDDYRALHADHVDADGSRHRAETRSSVSYLKELASGKYDVQLLCANCHAIKTYEEKRAGKIATKPRASWIDEDG